jgi:chromosome segregation ATPase
MPEADGGFVFSAQDALDRVVRDRERHERAVIAAAKDVAACRQDVERLRAIVNASGAALRHQRRRLTDATGSPNPDRWGSRERIAAMRAAASRDRWLLLEATERERALSDVLAAARAQLAQAADAQRLLEQVREARLREHRAHERRAADREADDAAIQVWRRTRPGG